MPEVHETPKSSCTYGLSTLSTYSSNFSSSNSSPTRQRYTSLRYAVLWMMVACALALGGTTVPHMVAASPASERGQSQAGVVALPVHHLTKRSFFEIQCKGVYDKSIFARLDRICEDCYNLFREPQLHSLCRKNCFTTDYFKGCLEALQLTDEMEQIQTWIKQLHGAEPGV